MNSRFLDQEFIGWYLIAGSFLLGIAADFVVLTARTVDRRLKHASRWYTVHVAGFLLFILLGQLFATSGFNEKVGKAGDIIAPILLLPTLGGSIAAAGFGLRSGGKKEGIIWSLASVLFICGGYTLLTMPRF